MLGLSGIFLALMCCLISMRLSFPEAVIGDLFMNYVKRIEEGGRDVDGS